jgi:small nuclear ribonucleoprotein (snRNP)-like protein
MNDVRPFDTLEASKGKKVIVKLKNGEEIIGTLIAGDIHMNIWLKDVEIVNEKRKVTSILIRGDNIVYIVTE